MMCRNIKSIAYQLHFPRADADVIDMQRSEVLLYLASSAFTCSHVVVEVVIGLADVSMRTWLE